MTLWDRKQVFLRCWKVSMGKRIQRVIPHKYTEEQKQFIRDFAFGHSHKEITEAFNGKFGTNLAVSQIKGSLVRYGANTGRTGYFPKGNVPHNKGKKMPPEVYERCKGTMFQKGQTPINHRPVGSERMTIDGYIEVKIAEPNKWKLKHRAVWEENYGKIPKNQCVIFLDGDTTNVEIENLALVDRHTNLLLNQHELRFDNKECTESGILIAEILKVVNKKGN